MEEIVSMERWASWNEEIKERLRRSARDFVAIGFRLRQIKDSGIYDGAADLYEFAQREYGLNKSAVSRFMAINEKYSEGGYGLTIASEYENYKYSQLTEMLTLPDNQHQFIDENTTVKDIRELKSFNAEEKEREEGQQIDMFNPVSDEKPSELKTIIKMFFKGKKTEFETIVDAINSLEIEMAVRTAAETLCPSGNKMFRVGLSMLMMQDYSRGMILRRMNQPDEKIHWEEFVNAFTEVFGAPFSDYEYFYPEEKREIVINTQPKEKKAPVATSQEKEVLVKDVETKEEAEGIVAKGTLTEEGKEFLDETEEKEETVGDTLCAEYDSGDSKQEDISTDDGEPREAMDEPNTDTEVIKENEVEVVPDGRDILVNALEKDLTVAIGYIKQRRWHDALDLVNDVSFTISKITNFDNDDEEED